MKRLLCVALVCILLSGCANEGPFSRTVFAMDTVMELQIWGKEAENVAGDLEKLLLDLEKTWSAAREDSFLSRLNRGEAVPDEEQQALLTRLEELSKRTGGAFDPKLQDVIALWGFLDQQYRVPTESEIAQALLGSHWNLGAAMKGYAGQQAVQLLEKRNVDRALLNLGGNVQTYGQKADGAPWRVGIRNPKGGNYVGLVEVTGTMAVVTSGDYQRYFEENGVKYHHILDPETGFPADTALASVTVICRDGLAADVLSTALFVMGLEEAVEFWRHSSDFEAVFVLSDGGIYATEGAKLTECVFEVIRREE